MNFCRSCGQDFASVAAFDYHLPPARLSPQEERLVHPDAAVLAEWGLVRDARGRWTMSEGRESGKGLERVQTRRVKPRGAIWPERLREVGLA